MGALHMLSQQPVFHAIEQALIGFLWQGAAVALAVAALLALLPQRASRARYATACLGLLAMAVFPILTFFSALVEAASLAPVLEQGPGVVGAQALDGTVTVVAALSGPEAHPTWAETLRPWLLPAWCVGVLFLSLRTFFAWSRTQRLSRQHIGEPDAAWRHALVQALARMRMAGPVRLVASSNIDVPMVIGLWRPLILVPAGAICGLTAAQLEAILAHELAHIRRHDYLVNLLQAVVETLLFYHPAVWWLSHRIREEREHCADDLAVQCCGDAYLYARALAHIEQLRGAPSPQPALGVGGGSLLARVRRLLVAAEPAAPRRPWRLASGVGGAALVTLLGASQVPETALADAPAPTPEREVAPAAPQASLPRAAPQRLLVPPAALASTHEAAQARPVARPSARVLPKPERAPGVKARAPRAAKLLIPDTQAIARTELPRVPYTLDAEPPPAELPAAPAEAVAELPLAPIPQLASAPEPVPAPTPDHSEVFALRPGITPPRFISGERMHYPNLSHEFRARLASFPKGSVITQCTITTEGSVTDCKPIKGLAGLEEPVMRTLSTWRYEPAMLDGKPVAVHYMFDIWFTNEPGGGAAKDPQQLAYVDMGKVRGAAGLDSCMMCSRLSNDPRKNFRSGF